MTGFICSEIENIPFSLLLIFFFILWNFKGSSLLTDIKKNVLIRLGRLESKFVYQSKYIYIIVLGIYVYVCKIFPY